MPKEPLKPFTWEFSNKEGRWTLTLANHVGSIDVLEDGNYFATLDGQDECSFTTLDDAVRFLKKSLSTSFRQKARQLNDLADDLLDPGENPF